MIGRRIATCIVGLYAALLAPVLPAQDTVTTQVVRDGSVGPDASVQPVSMPVVVMDKPGHLFLIGEDLGVRLGSDTVLHSFSRFDVAAGDSVVFTSDVFTGVNQLIAR